MRRTAAIVVAACLTAACAAPPSTPRDAVTARRPALPPVVVPYPATIEHADIAVPDVGAPVPSPTPRPSVGGIDACEIDSVAADEVIRRLEAEGLYVLDLTTHVENTGGRHATVSVAVLYGSGQSHPHHMRYRIRLHRSEHAWQVTAVKAAP